MKKLAIITTHPIQYNAPFFKLLTERGKVQLKVFYTWPQAIKGFNDPDFGKQIQWDIPLLEGYDWEAVENIARNPSSKYWKGIDCPNLNAKVTAFQPDAVMVYGWNLKSHFKALRHFKGRVPVWFFGDSTLLDEKPGYRKIMRRLWLTWVYRHIDKAFYVGTNNKAYFKTHGIKEDQLVFSPHAVDNERFFDNEERLYEKKAQRWRKELGFKENDIVLLFSGKLEPKKNSLILLEAVCQLLLNEREQSRSKAPQLGDSTITHLPNSPTPQLNLLFVGNGPLEPELKARSAGLNHIKFLPFQNQSDMPIVYRLGNVYCLPSQGPGETWGLAVNEAMACGRPIFVSNKVGCAVDLVESCKNGYIFDVESDSSLKERIEGLLQSDFKKMGQHSLNIIRGWHYINKCKAIENNI